MILTINYKTMSFILLAASANGFVSHQSSMGRSASSAFASVSPKARSVVLQPLAASPSSSGMSGMSTVPGTIDEVARLKIMAAKLRDEAASLEAEQKQVLAETAAKFFRRFDTNQDGQVTASELQQGLAKLFKMNNGNSDLTERRAQQLIQAFDTNQDGVLQLEEFTGVGVDAFRNKLDALVREERDQARQQAKDAQAAAEAAKIQQQQMELVNDKEPTTSDKIVSVLPYLFPLLDGLQFARFLVEGHPDNPLATTALVVYSVYRAIPLSGFISFAALSVLSDNAKLNKLIRFNMQQAVFLDIALFAPTLVVALLAGIATQGLGVEIPSVAVEWSNTAVFASLLATLAYTTTSSLAGQLPNKLPFVSQRVEDRMITSDMFDAEGRFAPFDEDGNLKKPNRGKKNDDMDGSGEH